MPLLELFLNELYEKIVDVGNLKGYFTIHDIIITKDELDKIWNKK